MKQWSALINQESHPTHSKSVRIIDMEESRKGSILWLVSFNTFCHLMGLPLSVSYIQFQEFWIFPFYWHPSKHAKSFLSSNNHHQFILTQPSIEFLYPSFPSLSHFLRAVTLGVPTFLTPMHCPTDYSLAFFSLHWVSGKSRPNPNNFLFCILYNLWVPFDTICHSFVKNMCFKTSSHD